MTTHVLMVVDRSGSMYSLAKSVRQGFNTYLDELAQQLPDDDIRITTILFSTKTKRISLDVPISKAVRLDDINYHTSGLTALLDAVGSTISNFETRIPPSGLHEHDRVILVIQTDGFENASEDFSYKDISKLINDRIDGGKWKVLYIGAGIDAWSEASKIGIEKADTFSVAATPTGQTATYGALSASTVIYHQGGLPEEVSRTMRRKLYDPYPNPDNDQA